MSESVREAQLKALIELADAAGLSLEQIARSIMPKIRNKTDENVDKDPNKIDVLNTLIERLKGIRDNEGGVYIVTDDGLKAQLDTEWGEKYIYDKHAELSNNAMFTETEFKYVVKKVAHSSLNDKDKLSRCRVHYDEAENAVYLDTGVLNRCTQISVDDICETDWPSNVLFHRGERMGALGEYDPKAPILDILKPWRPFTDEIADLLTVWAIKALTPIWQYTHLFLYGDSNSGKSSVTQILTALIDPSNGDPRQVEMRYPKQEKDYGVHVLSSYIMPYGNQRKIKDETLSDFFSTRATGGRMLVQRYYNQGKGFYISGQRLVLSNSIEDPIPATSTDLQDRALVVELPSWDSKTTPDDRVMWKEYYEYEPFVLGALYQAVQRVLRNFEAGIPARDAKYTESRLNYLCRIGELSKMWNSEGYISELILKNMTKGHENLARNDNIILALMAVCSGYEIGKPITKYGSQWADAINEHLIQREYIGDNILTPLLNRNKVTVKTLGLTFRTGRDKRGNILEVTYNPPIRKPEEDEMKVTTVQESTTITYPAVGRP